MEKINFQDRVGGDSKRKKLTIISQSADTIIADVESMSTPTQEGTSINAAVMNKFQDTIELAETKSNEAKTNASNALTTAGQANENASNALSNSQMALSTANAAEAKATEALSHVTESQGTSVTVAGEYVSTFDADTKADKSELSNYLTTNTTQDITNTKTIKKGLNINSYSSKVLQGGVSNTYGSSSYSGIRLCSINANGDLHGYFHIIGNIKETSVGLLTFDFNIHFFRAQSGNYKYYYTGNDLSILNYFDLIIEGTSAPFYITLLKKNTYAPTGMTSINLWQVDSYGLGYSTSLEATFSSLALSGTNVSHLS